MVRIAHQTQLGKYYIGDTERFFRLKKGRELKGKVQLILTSPPFPLNRKKSYGNLQGEDYKS